MTDLLCPYCNEGLEVCHDDGFGFEEDVPYEMECSQCGKSFMFRTAITFSYTASKAPCLNGQPHEYEPSTTSPKAFTLMICKWCEDMREPTAEERVTLKLPTKASYFEELHKLQEACPQVTGRVKKDTT